MNIRNPLNHILSSFELRLALNKSNFQNTSHPHSLSFVPKMHSFLCSTSFRNQAFLSYIQGGDYYV